MLIDAIDNYLESREKGHIQASKVWVGDVWACPRRAMLRIDGAPITKAHGPKTLRRFDIGNTIEAGTYKILCAVYGAPSVVTQLRLSWDIFVGRPDFVIHPETDFPVVVEFKAPGTKARKFWNSIPKLRHLYQIGLYKYMYEKIHECQAKAILLYRSYSRMAEFEISLTDDLIEANGIVEKRRGGGVRDRVKIIDNDIEESMDELRSWYEVDEIPPVVANPRCCWRDKPSCVYYDHCWSEEDEPWNHEWRGRPLIEYRDL